MVDLMCLEGLMLIKPIACVSVLFVVTDTFLTSILDFSQIDVMVFMI